MYLQEKTGAQIEEEQKRKEAMKKDQKKGKGVQEVEVESEEDKLRAQALVTQSRLLADERQKLEKD